MALRVVEERAVARFEESVLPQLGAAYNLARWLTRNEHDAEDLVQEALLRAFKAFPGFRGTDARAWLLAIVRNACYTWLRRTRAQEVTTVFDEEVHTQDGDVLNPERLVLQEAERTRVCLAREELLVEFREVLVLREIEGLSYKEVATVADIPVGTVMSRLARARGRLQRGLAGPPSSTTSSISRTAWTSSIIWTRVPPVPGNTPRSGRCEAHSGTRRFTSGLPKGLRHAPAPPCARRLRRSAPRIGLGRRWACSGCAESGCPRVRRPPSSPWLPSRSGDSDQARRGRPRMTSWPRR
ncbi:MAG: RNA polymerase subunit sigma [Acidobacteria bacterium]|nr:MAG: RNA polymerase subunit sigma [Acidobacteriota bacterium]